ncbi:hypothetical protein ACROYT_G012355 [Oculina patagonica]
MARTARAKHYRTTGDRKKVTQTSVARAALDFKRIQKKLVSESSTNSVPVEAEKQKKNKKKTAPRLNLKGNRIVDLTHFSKSLQKVINHSSVCPCNGNPHMEQEIERKGLACVIQFRCDECGITLGVATQPKSKGPRGQPRYSINIAAVWGFMATGGGHSNMEEILSLLNIPSPDKKTFTKIEEHVGAVWKEALTADMIEAGKEEKRLAVASNNLDQGIPAINVVVDGGWSMRSHQHRYTAKSGVAVIIGERTKKLLYLGVRNKYCSICAIAASNKKPPQSHKCYKNWDESSSSMEKDILVEGFKQSETTHGVRYIGLIGDGDSSVHKAVVDSVPAYGSRVRKIECANHAVRCYRKSLHDLVEAHPEWKGRNGLSKMKIKKIAAGARAAMKMHSKTGDVEALRRDLRNGPYHVFGDHRKCSVSFCKAKQAVVTGDCDVFSVNINSEESETSVESSSPTMDLNDDLSTFCEISNQIADLVNEDISEEDEENSRLGGHYLIDKLPAGLMSQILKKGDRIVSLAPQLVSNKTSNSAETYMSINAKFNGGKQVNRIQRGSFEIRCAGAGLCFQHGAGFHSKVWEQCIGEKAGPVLEAHCADIDKKRTADRVRQASTQSKETRRKAKSTQAGQCNTSKSNDYGVNTQQADIESQELKKLCEENAERMQLSQEQIKSIEHKTRDQSKCQLWYDMRKNRLTASKFGEISKRRKSTPCSRIVKDMLYPKTFSNDALKWGNEHEKTAIQEYCKATGNTCTRLTFSQRVTPTISQLRTWVIPVRNDRLSRLIPHR